MTLEEKIDKLFRTISHGSGLSLYASQWKAFQKAEPFWKDEILALIKEETVKARVEELERIDKANKDNGINFWFEDMKPQNNGWRNMRQYVPERIAQL